MCLHSRIHSQNLLSSNCRTARTASEYHPTSAAEDHSIYGNIL